MAGRKLSDGEKAVVPTWKELVLPAILVTTTVVIGAYLVFRSTLGSEAVPTIEVFVMIATITLSLFVCAKVVADIVRLTKDRPD